MRKLFSSEIYEKKLKMTVVILLSTYNGEKYLKSCISSIINQKGVEIKILVRDDGSTDSSYEILEELRDERINLSSSRCHYGVVNSYKKLLEESIDEEFEFLAFADQDDIWLPNKINDAIQKLNKERKDLYSSARIVLKNDKIQGLIPKKKQDNLNLISNLFENYSANCTMVMTRLFAEKIVEENFLSNSPSVDHTLMQYALIQDAAIFDSKSQILYRLHSKNDIGISSHFNLLSRYEAIKVYRRQLQFLLNLKGNEAFKKNPHFAQIQELSKSKKEKFLALKNTKFRTNKIENLLVKIYLYFSKLD